ncbi:MAG: hypothetical protein DRO87_12705 [Candidatus Thorarchaeota archaeon]|nr:MAG: hypothetical protein DRO87_12705 [Candidatus Thorarchaeota archaeon]
MQRVMVFIDGINFRKAWQTECSKKKVATRTKFNAVVLRRLLASLRPDWELVGTRYHSSMIPPKDSKHYKKVRGIDPNGFHGFLSRNGYSCKIRKSRVRHQTCPICRNRFQVVKEKGVDVAIALDITTNALADVFDTALLVSGDADFIPVADLLTKNGKEMDVAQFSNAISWNLRRSVRRVYELDQYFDKLVTK